MDFSLFKTDPRLEEEGNWVPCPGSGKIKVARMNSRRVARCIEKRCAVYGLGKGLTDVPEEDYEDVIGDVCAEGVLIDWEGMTVNQVAVPFDLETARKYCKEPEYRDFRRFVLASAQNAEHFRRAYLEGGEKK